ncbi:diguanylate cyclase domain-containing protein [Alkanindiges sp. WGS2144]|uniref:diguanylate cyclase domain-containing protein n=1 Tax=Alkanindiges sp. WGS2144 TaxID=3366808 RepID=UPI0037507166
MTGNTAQHSKKAKRQPSLQRLFRNTHLLVLLVTLLISGTLLSIVSFFSLDDYAKRNLQLIASSVSFRVEAGVVFDDRAAIQETINQLAYRNEFREIKVLDNTGQTIAELKHHYNDSFEPLRVWFNQWIFSEPVTVPITHNDQTIGTVWLMGNAEGIFSFLGKVLLGLLGCLIITVICVSYCSLRTHNYILHSFKKITNVANLVREQRAFNLRIPSSSISELEDLSQDFNSLLDEIERWHQHIKAENDTLLHKATHDSLTGLVNRNYFEAQLDTLFTQTQPDNPLALLFIDHDRFKQINDTYGHTAGDQILIEVGKRLVTRLRQKDVVARWGGDEFAVILPEIIDKKNAVAVAESILAGVEDPIIFPDGQCVHISLSIGIALSTHCKSPEQLLAKADAAMYRAKLVPSNSWSVLNNVLFNP